MADAPKPSQGFVPIPENPELANLEEREASLQAELDRLEKMDATKISREPGYDFGAVKNRVKTGLAETRKAIQETRKAIEEAKKK